MKLQRVDYESGHWIEDNHVGDYDFHCPAAGRLAFVHMGQVASLSLSFCKSCGKMIGNIKSGTPYEWETEHE